MGDGWLGLSPIELRVEVGQPRARGYGHLEHHLGRHCLLHEEVVERAKVVVLGDEPQLRHAVVGHHVAGKEPEDVVVAQEEGVVDLGLAAPRFLVAGEKLFHGHRFSLVVAKVHLPVATVADELCDFYRAGDRPLDEEGQARAAARSDCHLHELHLPGGS